MMTTIDMATPHSCDMAFLRNCFSLTSERQEMYRSLGAERLLESMAQKQRTWSVICDYVEVHGLLGMVLRNANSSQWCVITPDPDPGFYRYTGFDRRGFYMHGQYRKPEEALLEVFRMGFRFVDGPDILESLSSAPEWMVV